MHIPSHKQRVHWNNTAPDGTCALVALAQVCELLLNQSFRAVPEVTADDATWMRKMLQPLKDYMTTTEGEHVIAWEYYGFSHAEEERKNIDPDRKEPTSEQWIPIERLIEIAIVLNVHINIWTPLYTEVKDLEPDHRNHVTKYVLAAVIRAGEEVNIFDATVSQILDWFGDSDSVDIIQTHCHYFVHPDSSQNHKHLVDTLMAAIDKWMTYS